MHNLCAQCLNCDHSPHNERPLRERSGGNTAPYQLEERRQVCVYSEDLNLVLRQPDSMCAASCISLKSADRRRWRTPGAYRDQACAAGAAAGDSDILVKECMTGAHQSSRPMSLQPKSRRVECCCCYVLGARSTRASLRASHQACRAQVPPRWQSM